MTTSAPRRVAHALGGPLAVLRGVRPLLRPLWLREQRDRRLAALLALSLVAALGTAAYAYASEAGRGTTHEDAVTQAMLLTGGFRSTIGVVFAMVAVLLPIDRLASLRKSRWCLPFLARGTAAASIVLGTAAAITTAVLAAFTISYVMFALAMIGLALASPRLLILGYVATAPALIAWTSYGTLAGVVTRGRNAGVALAIAGVVVPSLLVTAWTMTQGHAPPVWAMWVWAVGVPIPVHVASWTLLVERVRYVLCAAWLIGLLSHRRLIPHE